MEETKPAITLEKATEMAADLHQRAPKLKNLQIFEEALQIASSAALSLPATEEGLEPDEKGRVAGPREALRAALVRAFETPPEFSMWINAMSDLRGPPRRKFQEDKITEIKVETALRLAASAATGGPLEVAEDPKKRSQAKRFQTCREVREMMIRLALIWSDLQQPHGVLNLYEDAMVSVFKGRLPVTFEFLDCKLELEDPSLPQLPLEEHQGRRKVSQDWGKSMSSINCWNGKGEDTIGPKTGWEICQGVCPLATGATGCR